MNLPAPFKAVTRSLSRSVGSLFGDSAQPDNPQRYRIPIAGESQSEGLKIANYDGLVSLIARDASLNEILSLLARTQGLNIIASDIMDARVSMTLERVPLEQVLDSVLTVAGYTWYERNGVTHVTSTAGGASLPPEIQGRRIEVFELDYAAATDGEQALSVMLSPVGKAFVMQSDKTDNRKTREAVVVEDLPGTIERIRQYVEKVDRAPRQVLVEAHILEIELSDDTRDGVNFRYLFDLFNRPVQFDITGFANPAAPSSFFLSIDSTDVEGLIQCLKTTTDAKTLASPKVLVLNGQTARIQIGEQLGFRVTTTTETSTMESVDFLDVGVVMEVTPRISRDNRVLLNIKPEVSSGEVNPDTGLPEEETTEVQTSVLLDDGKGLVIGGLIQERDSNVQTKVPYLGDLFLIGKLFQKRQILKSRSEIIITLVPRVVPYDCQYQQQEDTEVMRSQTPLVYGPLHRYPRPWEAQLPDAVRNPTLVRLPPVREILRPQRQDGPCQDGYERDSAVSVETAEPLSQHSPVVVELMDVTP